MRGIALLALTVLAGTTGASAQDSLHLTPPLFREQARATQQVQAAADLRVVAQPVFVRPAKASGKVVAEAGARPAL